MFSFLLQDWLTMRVDKNIASVTQDASGWLALPEFQDVVFWTDWMGATKGGATTDFNIVFETAPIPDERMFKSMATLSAVSNGPAFAGVNPVLTNQNPAVPLATWVRWKLATTATPVSTWGITFRVRVAANATSKYYLSR